MKVALLACTFLLLSGFLDLAQAQDDSDPGFSTDSTIYDLGRLTLKKKNVQAITIKGADLQKMPFTNLKDAINIYVNGIYSARQDYAFVIDGILNTDINAYSIYDIDEITIVQNATATLNGVDGSKTLVLVKTKHGGPGRSGVTVAGQSDFIRLVKSSPFIPDPAHSANNGRPVNTMYHQYYVSAYGNSDIIKAGVSAEILHNAIPLGANIIPVAFNYYQDGPINTNRYKFNGYLDVKLGEGNVLSINTGYVPQRDITDETNDIPNSGGHNYKYNSNLYGSQNLFYTDIKLTTKIAEGLTNKVSAGFQRLRQNAHVVNRDYRDGAFADYDQRDSVSAINSYVAKDDISYQTQIGDFTLQPNLNFTFRQAGNPRSADYLVLVNGQTQTVLGNQYFTPQQLAILTPSLTLTYLNWVTLQGGFQTYLNSTAPVKVLDHDQTTPLPFVTASVDLATPLEVDTDQIRLNVFGSYARNFTYANDLSGSLLDNYFIHVGNNANFSTAPDPYQVYTQIQGGLTVSFVESKVALSYNYDLKRFSASQVTIVTDPLYVASYSNASARIELHRLSADFTMPTDGLLKWHTNLNGTLVIMRDSYKIANYLPEYLRLVYPGKPLVTGGFINQLSYQNLYLDFGVIYAMNQAVINHAMITQVEYIDTYAATGKANTFNLQNIDIGYKIPVKAFKSLEVYASARNLFQNDQSEFVNSARYIGAGFKIGL